MSNPITSPTTYYGLEKLKIASEALADANGLHGYDPIIRDSKGNPLELGSASTNAIAHTLSSAYLAYDYSKAEASALGWAREYKSYWLDERPAAWDTFKDLYNNQVGRNISDYAKQNNLSRDQIQDLVLDALSTGKLIVTQQDARIDPSFNGNPAKFSVPGGDAAALWTGPSAGFSEFAPTVHRVSVPTPDGSGDWSLQPTGMDITIIQLGTDTGDNNTAFAPIADGVEQTQFAINGNNQLTQLGAFNDNGSSTKTVFDTGTEPWSSQTSAFDAFQRLQSQRVVLDGGGQQVKQYDPNNTHPYSEFDIDEDASGKITGARPTFDGQTATADFSAVGQVLGSALGRALAPNNQFVQLVAGTVVGAVGQRLAQAFVASLATDGSKFDPASVFADFNVSIAGAGASSIASFLVAELGTALHVPGFSGQLFNAAFGGFTGSVASQIATKMAATPGLTFEAAISGVNFADAAVNAAYGVSALFGSFLGNELVPAQTHTGAVGGQLLGAVGSAVGITAAVANLLGSALNFLLPGVGSLIGTIIGTLIGDAFDHTPHPAAVDRIDQRGYLYDYNHYQVSASDGGDYSIADPMGRAAISIINAYLTSVKGAALDHSKQVVVGYLTDPQPFYINGVPGHPVNGQFLQPDGAVQAAALDVLQYTEVIGGDLFLKRAHQNSTSNHQQVLPPPDPRTLNGDPGPTGVLTPMLASAAEQLAILSGDLQVAQDYENYLNNREAINALMAANPNSAFTAGWIATFARVQELGLNHVNASDFLGGLVGYLDSVNKAGLSSAAASASVSYDGNFVNGVITISIKLPNGVEVPGSLAAFADATTVSSDASGQTVQLIIGANLAAVGYHRPDAWVTAGDGFNDLWFGDGSGHTFNGTGGHDILVGGAGNDTLYGDDGNDPFASTLYACARRSFASCGQFRQPTRFAMA
jgi:RTX calcium-binding nonapeptide repeat (4 copies)